MSTANVVDEVDRSEDPRTRYERDLDRILYSRYFLRLAEITQVYAPSQRDDRARGALLHNRLTHSLKVGQVGRRLAQKLNRDAGKQLVDPDIVEAAGRAHDFGHPPFGHLGERVLDAVARRNGLRDGFEGNAQTFRILALLDVHQSVDAGFTDGGLHLDHRVLAACVKYPWPRGESESRFLKYGHYDCDASLFDGLVRPMLSGTDAKSLEAEIMDWADDITYAVHDVDDFYRAALIPLDRLAHTQDGASYIPSRHEEAEAFISYGRSQYEGGDIGLAVHEFRKNASLFPRRPFDGSRIMRALLGATASRVITQAINATTAPSGHLKIEPPSAGLIGMLKQLTWFYVIDRPAMAATQRGQAIMLGDLCQALIQWGKSAFDTKSIRPWGVQEPLSSAAMSIRRQALETELREAIELQLERNAGDVYEGRELNVARGTIDYVSGLTERDVLELYETLRPPPANLAIPGFHD